MGVVVGRDADLELINALLDRARGTATTLVIDGEPGIGKTTLCRAAIRAAAEAGFADLSTTGSVAEASLAWAGLTDLLSGLDEAALGEVSELHQRALRAVSAGLEIPVGDERLVAAAFRAALGAQCRHRPVAMVVDDAQWLDGPTRLVLGFAARRIAGPVMMITAFRSGDPGSTDQSWLAPADPQAMTRLTLRPMGNADVKSLITNRLGRTPEPKTVARICAASGGNPFYALELARASGGDGAESDALPPTLAKLMSDRIGVIDDVTAAALLTAAVAFEPTVDIVAAAVEVDAARVVDLFTPLEARGVLALDGTRIRFAHPLIASSIITTAKQPDYRRVHRRLAYTVASPEQRARHLALSTPHGDVETLQALDAAAETAAMRGASSTAAELSALAVERGGDNEFRRLRGAELHFRAGALDKAETLLAPVVDDLSAGFMRAVGLMLLAAIRGFRDGLASTIGLLEGAVSETGEDPMLRAQALMLLSTATGIGGDMASSVRLAGQARADADTTGLEDLRSQALAVWVAANMIHGNGLDSGAMRTALELENHETTAPIMFRPTSVSAQTCAWTGRLDDALSTMREVLHMAAERGDEIGVVWAAEQLTMIEVFLGRYADAQRTAADAVERARQIGGRLPLIGAHTAVANEAAHRGRLEETRTAAGLAVAGATAGDLTYVTRAPLMSLAFVQVSDGQYEEALQTLKPLLSSFDPEHEVEIMMGRFIPDAVEALVGVGRHEEAEPFVAALESGGVRHDRPWMLAVGARCRALVHAAEGDLDAALEAAQAALAHHDRLPMPFERARTQLLLGQLQRRRRRTAAAHENLSQAAAAFDELGSPLWAQRAHSELSRLTARTPGAALTDSERQVAEHAAAGLTNRQIAATLFLSEKTVEMHLSNAYRKLGIRSRAQLAERLRNG